MHKIEIQTKSRPSVVYCGKGALEQANGEILKGRDLFVVTDSKVARIYSDLIRQYFPNASVCVFSAGEKNKNQRTLFSILDKMVECGCNRKTTLVALGGGVVGDVAGLAASLYMRGMHLVQIPTTLLAQVDSSVGGKTAIDYKGYKNIVGVFYQPEYVICDPLFLQTLPQREIRCGLGEIIKTAALDGTIFDEVKERRRLVSDAFLEKVIAQCIRFKGSVVERDEQEVSGLRKCLNMGHTTAHALELNYGKKSHGEYVLIGMYYESKIALAEGVCNEEYCESLQTIIMRILKEIPHFENIEEAAKSALFDKKNDAKNEISLILPKARGEYTEIFLSLSGYTRYLRQINGGAL